MNDAQVRLAERLAPDLERMLGSTIQVEDLAIEGDGPVMVRVMCLIDGRSRQIEARGETAIEAMTAMIQLAAETRLAAAFGQLTRTS
jgi:hypothetical protein